MLSNPTFSQFNSQAESFLHNMKNTTNKSLQVPSLMKVTFDCGVQTNLEDRQFFGQQCEENPQNTEDVLMKKKQKRKQYKKRKKIQQKLMQRQNRQQFKRIIDLFYQRDAKFIDYADKLQQLVCSFNQNDFKNMFDSILKQRVVIIQNSIWQYTQAILDTNPALMRHDHPFFYEMVDQIYKYYRLIQRSSIQAQHVIYIYLSLNSKDPDEQITSQNLDIRTFRYLVETDDDIKKLIKTCDQKISIIRIQQRLKLEVIISKLKNFRQKYYTQHFDQQDEDQNEQYYDQEQDDYDEQDQNNREQNQNYDEKSTTISQNVEQFDDQHNNNLEKRKKNKKKLKGNIMLKLKKIDQGSFLKH